MNEELDSQLSAMFDDELPAAECELLARRLSRDEAAQGTLGPLRGHRRGHPRRARGAPERRLAGRVSAAHLAPSRRSGGAAALPAPLRARPGLVAAGRRGRAGGRRGRSLDSVAARAGTARRAGGAALVATACHAARPPCRWRSP